MGFLRKLFGGKKHCTNSQKGTTANGSGPKPARRWSFVKPGKDTTTTQPASTSNFCPYPQRSDANNKHAIAVAEATAAVAEAALAAAHAAAEVVRLTSNGGRRSAISARVSGRWSQQRRPEEVAAVKIQSAFRGYLARRALRALKALVKLQALVRGHIVRKQTADMYRRMQTLVRLQARARASRVHIADNVHWSKPPLPRHIRSSSNSNIRDIEHQDRLFLGSNWLDRWTEESKKNSVQDVLSRNWHTDDDKSDKILEVDTWKPRLKSCSFQASRNYVWSSDYNNDYYMAYDSPSKHSTKSLSQIPCLSSREALPYRSSHILLKEKDEAGVRTVENSPQAFSASSKHGSGARRGPFTPTRSEFSWGFLSAYAGHPNYMANTESSRAKVRSHSAPRQRLDFEKYGSTRSVQGPWDFEFQSKAYPASSRLNRTGSANLR